jgi:hypothetical protein
MESGISCDIMLSARHDQGRSQCCEQASNLYNIKVSTKLSGREVHLNPKVPKRGRLAQQMAADHPLKPDDKWQAMQDLHALCVQDFTVLYLPRSRPVDGACPVKCCQMQLERLVFFTTATSGDRR